MGIVISALNVPPAVTTSPKEYVVEPLPTQVAYLFESIKISSLLVQSPSIVPPLFIIIAALSGKINLTLLP